MGLIAKLGKLWVKFHAVLGYTLTKNRSTTESLAAVSHYYESIISCMPGNVYWLSTTGVAQGCNKNVLAMFGFSSIDEFRGLDFEGMGQTMAFG